MPIALVCKHCSKTFYAKSSHAHKRVFCSYRCRTRYDLRPEILIARFWSYVDKNMCVGTECGCHRNLGHCWPWIGGHSRDGYGNFRIDYQQIKAHRFAYELHHGPLLGPGFFVCHKCDYPPCCNHQHLFCSSPQGNMDDAWAKGRMKPFQPLPGSRCGSKNARAKLSENQIPEIRVLKGILSAAKVAERYGVSPSMINWIWKGASWTHV